MKIVLTGTGNPMPDPNRAGPSTLVQAGENNFVFDCGRAVTMRLLAAGVAPPMINAVLITHLHSDHITDLNDIMTSRWIMSPHATPLPIIGPLGTRDVVDSILKMLGPDQHYRNEHHADLRSGIGLICDIREVVPGDAFDLGGVQISIHQTDHRPVNPTIGYRVMHEGKTAAIAGDTIPCAGVDAMCLNADAYVQTVIRDDQVRALAGMLGDFGQRFADILDYHSTVAQAAETAQRCGVKNLMLTHYVPAMQDNQIDEWRELASHFQGNVILGSDLTFLEL